MSLSPRSDIVFFWSDKSAPMRTIVRWPCLVPKIKIMWEEQLVDPPIDYITIVNVHNL